MKKDWKKSGLPVKLLTGSAPNSMLIMILTFHWGVLFAEGRIVFYNGNIFEFTESITPDRFKYRYHYMTAESELIFRYDNVPHHFEISTFPDHKHLPGKIVESNPVNIKKVVEEIIELLVS